MKLDLLLTDWMILGLVTATIFFIFIVKSHPHLHEPWKRAFHNKLGMIGFVILCFYTSIGTLDSIHLQITDKNPVTHQTTISHTTVFDLIIGDYAKKEEKTYSKPFAIHSHQRSWVRDKNGKEIFAYARLTHGGNHLKDVSQHHSDILLKTVTGLFLGAISFIPLLLLWIYFLYYRSQQPESFTIYFKQLILGKTSIAWREAVFTTAFLWVLVWIFVFLASGYHLFGTNKIGEDVFNETIKSIRTGLLIGTLTTIIMLPFALFFGMLAGYFSGWIDDAIQYLYTTLSSIPGVLLISATILVMQVYISNHPELFPSLADRADARLLALCLILGITSWASLCRLLRAETLKLREQDFVTASITMGATSFHILIRHILPNVMHIVLITIVLDFSGLVLAESILSYVGVGVDPTTSSWGNIINTSRLELAREPMVWWPLLGALIVMFFFVLSANLFADAVRDAFDPRLKNSQR